MLSIRSPHVDATPADTPAPSSTPTSVTVVEQEGSVQVSTLPGDFSVQYQPVLDLRDGSMHTGDAVLRWWHPVFGVLRPGPSLKGTTWLHEVRAIETWSLHEVCRQAAAWLDLQPEIELTANLSPARLLAPDLLATVDEALAAAELDPQHLAVAVPLGAVAVDPVPLARTMGGLARRGVRVVMDGVGAGASLSAIGLVEAPIWRIDVLLVESRRGFAELGLYSVAVAVAEVVVVLAMALRSAMLPHHGGEDDNLVEVIMRTTRVALVVTTGLAVGLAAVGPLLLGPLFGSGYAQTYPALVLLLPGTVFLVLHYPLFDYVAARGNLGSLTLLGVVSLLFNIVVNYWALGRWSYVAAAVVSSLTYALVFFGCVRLFLLRSGRSVRDTLVIRRSDLDAVVELARGADRGRFRPRVRDQS